MLSEATRTLAKKQNFTEPLLPSGASPFAPPTPTSGGRPSGSAHVTYSLIIHLGHDPVPVSNDGYDWKFGSVVIPADTVRVSVSASKDFSGGDSYKGDIAIDDISITYRDVPTTQAPTAASTPWATGEGTVTYLLAHMRHINRTL